MIFHWRATAEQVSPRNLGRKLMTFEDIKVGIEDGIGTITIDRGDGRNALRPHSLREICIAVDALAEDASVRALILTGAGKHFSAGADFAFLEELTTTKATAIRDQVYTVFQGAAKRIYNCPKPTIAAINGAAITVGCELSLACDARVITPTAQFQESWIRLGLMPPLGGLFLLPRHVGLGRASEILLSGRAVAAEEADRIGLATRLVAVEELADAARALAAEYAALPPLAYRAVKEGIHRGMESSMDKEWATNVLAQTMLLGSDDFREGLSAVKERRQGKFGGR
jgi:enoyl-CoA hydratase/carnithine racemase